MAAGCGESDAEKAQKQVCDARDDLNKQVNELAALTPATATTEGVQDNLDAIQNDLNDIKDAQGDLNEDRNQEVESANQEFTSQLQAVKSDLGTNLSASGAKAQVQSAATQLQPPTSRPSRRSTATEGERRALPQVPCHVFATFMVRNPAEGRAGLRWSAQGSKRVFPAIAACRGILLSASDRTRTGDLRRDRPAL
jgi:hypothetical protein